PVLQPPFETHETSACLSYIVEVSGIDSKSVKLTFPSTSSLRLQFSDSEKKLYEMHVAVLPVDIDPSAAEVDVASENMVVILQKKNASDSSREAVQLDASAPAAPLTAARFQNQLLYELD
ncbi:hypothetical protein GN958_ATG04079, partial [Phytophthora infestans]